MACSGSNAASPVKTFETAVEMLNAGKSAAEIYKLLSSVKRFKEFLPKEAPKPVFAVPAPVSTFLGNKHILDSEKGNKDDGKHSVLSKRTPPKQQEEEKKDSPAKRQATGQATITSGCQHLDCKRVAFFTVLCVLCLNKTKDAW